MAASSICCPKAIGASLFSPSIRNRGRKVISTGERLHYLQEAVQEGEIGECAEWIFPPGMARCHPICRSKFSLWERPPSSASMMVSPSNSCQLARASQIAVPEDLSIVGVGNFGAEPWGLTTMGSGFPEIGQRAVDGLVNLIGGGPVEKSRIVVPVALYERQSVKDLRTR